MSTRNVSIIEPHPTVPKAGGAYITSGRGGAGNYKHCKAEDLTTGPSANGPASLTSSFGKTLKRQYLPAGRGGSGNMFVSNKDHEQRMFQFDEEMERRTDNRQAPVYHIGRGGAANFIDERDELSTRSRQDSVAAESTHSNESRTSNVRGALNKLTRRFS